IRVGDGLDPASQMGPLANERRVESIARHVSDAASKGATIACGGERIGNRGFFFAPTVLTNVARDANVMNEEPFGPLAIVSPFGTFDDAVAEANRLGYGLAAYAFTTSTKTARSVAAALEAGMVSVNGA